MEPILNKKFLCTAEDDHIYITRYGKIFDVTSGTVGASDKQFMFINTKVGNGERTFVIEHEFTISNVIKAFQSGEKARDHERKWSVEDMFSGHGIVVWLNPDFTLNSAELS